MLSTLDHEIAGSTLGHSTTMGMALHASASVTKSRNGTSQGQWWSEQGWEGNRGPGRENWQIVRGVYGWRHTAGSLCAWRSLRDHGTILTLYHITEEP